MFLAGCLIYGWISGSRMRMKYSKKINFIVTKPCGLRGSQNDDTFFTVALENQSYAILVTMKLIRKG